MTQDAASRAITKIQAEYGGIFGFDRGKRAYLEQCVRAEYAELVKVTRTHVADLKEVEKVLRADGRFKETADEVLVAIGELSEAVKAVEGV